MALDETAIRHLVLTELAKKGERYLPVGISARHVHLSAADIERLFGPGHTLTPIKPLVQPGQYASKEQVTLVGPKGELSKVRILGPARAETQVELAFTDAMKLGIKNVPVRMSGKLEGTPGIRLVGPAGEIAVDHGVIAAARHIHMSNAQAQAYGVHDGMVVSVRVGGERPCLLENVVCRTGDAHELEIHLDTDEANACGLSNGDYVELVLPGTEGGCCMGTCQNGSCTCAAHSAPPAPPEEPKPEVLDLVVERNISDAYRDGRQEVYCERAALVTPSAADRAEELGIRIVRMDPVHVPTPPRPEPERVVLELVTETDLNDAYRDNRTEVYCTKQALITDAAQDRMLETGIRVIRV